MNTRISIKACAAVVICAGLLVGCHDRHHKVKDRKEVVIERTEPVPQREVIVEREAPPPPRTVVITEPPPPTREVVIVREAPPPIIVETAPPPPMVGMVWVQGYWVHDHGHYAWCKGRYVRPEPGRRFEPARWEHSRRGWEFHGERWGDDEPHKPPHGKR